jgi:hypothetical protein
MAISYLLLLYKSNNAQQTDKLREERYAEFVENKQIQRSILLLKRGCNQIMYQKYFLSIIVCIFIINPNKQRQGNDRKGFRNVSICKLVEHCSFHGYDKIIKTEK